MNNLQFYVLLAPSIGSLVIVVLAWIHSNSRLTRLEHTVDQQSAEMRTQGAELRAEMRAQGAEMRAQGAELRAEMRALRTEMTSLRDVVYNEMVSLHERVTAVEAGQR